MRQVFLSSTSRDLAACRDAACQGIEEEDELVNPGVPPGTKRRRAP